MMLQAIVDKIRGRKPEPTNALKKDEPAKKADTSLMAYRQYVIEAQTNGEQAMPLAEWRKSRQPKNALAE